MGTLRLTLLRHGQARPAEAYATDIERALTMRGRREAAAVGRRLHDDELIPDLILASPAVRTWTTAEIVARTCRIDAALIQSAPEFYLASVEAIWRRIVELRENAGHVLVCAHNPGLSHLASLFGPVPERRDLPTAGTASAVWNDAAWATVTPESANQCDLHSPRRHA